MTDTPPVVAIVVTKRNRLVTAGRPQKYRWKALNWNNKKKLATSGEAYTNRADALAAAVQLFADDTVDPELLRQAGVSNVVVSRASRLVSADWKPANVYLIQDGVSGMQAMRLVATE